MTRNTKSLKKNDEACRGILIAPSKLPHFSFSIETIQCLERNLCRKKTKIIALQALLGRKPSATLNPQRH
jgi:hypothetical protein